MHPCQQLVKVSGIRPKALPNTKEIKGQMIRNIKQYVNSVPILRKAFIATDFHSYIGKKSTPKSPFLQYVSLIDNH